MKKRTDRKAQRRIEADERKAVWERLPTLEKLKILETRPGQCIKQIRRILKNVN